MSDHWEFYYTGIDDHPAGILVDLGIVDDAPRAELGELVTLHLQLKRTDEYGMPPAEDVEPLDRVEDFLEEGLAELDAETDYVGRCTSQGLRVFFYYTSDPSAVEVCLKSTMATLPDFQCEVKTENDPEWSRYFEVLYPSDREQQIIGNAHVLANLQSAGDKPEIEREVVHWIYFPNPDLRANFQRIVQELGLETVEKQDQSVGDNPFSLCIGKVMSLDEIAINELVLELFDLAAENQGEYTGWETSVQRG